MNILWDTLEQAVRNGYGGRETLEISQLLRCNLISIVIDGTHDFSSCRQTEEVYLIPDMFV